MKGSGAVTAVQCFQIVEFLVSCRIAVLVSRSCPDEPKCFTLLLSAIRSLHACGTHDLCIFQRKGFKIGRFRYQDHVHYFLNVRRISCPLKFIYSFHEQ